MKILKELIQSHKRWFPFVIVSTLIFVLWFQRETIIYSNLPSVFGEMQIFIFDVVFVSLALTSLISVYSITRCPPFTKLRVNRAFQRAGLKNDKGEYPILVAVTSDPSKPHGKRYKIRNFGVSIKAIETKKDSLESELGGIIYEQLYPKDRRFTYLYVLLTRYVQTEVMPPADDDEF